MNKGFWWLNVARWASKTATVRKTIRSYFENSSPTVKLVTVKDDNEKNKRKVLDFDFRERN